MGARVLMLAVGVCCLVPSGSAAAAPAARASVDPPAVAVPADASDPSYSIPPAGPQPVVITPADGTTTSGSAQVVSGIATIGDTVGAQPTVSVTLYAGTSTMTAAPLQTIAVPVTATGIAGVGAWSVSFGALTPGATYTVQAEEVDDSGNMGVSNTSTFSVIATPVPAGIVPVVSPASEAPVALVHGSPHAAIAVVPASGVIVGAPVTFVSISSPGASSSIVGLDWDLTGKGAFKPAGGSLTTTSFSTAGTHVVRLRVTDADGLSSVATVSIVVHPAALSMLTPFPIVQVDGSFAAGGGTRLSRLTVQLPVGSKLGVRCFGAACPFRTESVAESAPRGQRGATTVLVRLVRLQRTLPAGTRIEISVTKGRAVGKFTSLVMRRGKAPLRTDLCLVPGRPGPTACS
jgi:hypothetical protein